MHHFTRYRTMLLIKLTKFSVGLVFAVLIASGCTPAPPVSQQKSGSDRMLASVPEKEVNRCTVEGLATEVTKLHATVPTTLYHYGPRYFLFKNIALENIDSDVWTKSIMGERTASALPAYRRGLYGSENPSDADPYGEAKLDDPGDPYSLKSDRWLMQIDLKPECVEPKHVYSIAKLNLDPRFQEWLGAHVEYSAVANSGCFSGRDGINTSQFTLYKALGKPLSDCEKMVTAFFADVDPWIVYDPSPGLPRSWQVRRRECIRKLSGTPQDWAFRLKENLDLWKNDCSARTHEVRLILWLRSVIRLPDDQLEKFRSTDWKQWFKNLGPNVPLVVVSSADDDGQVVDLSNFSMEITEAFRQPKPEQTRSKLLEILSRMNYHENKN